MKKKNLLVFDIDDTITKSEHQHQKAYTDAMLYFGINDINRNWSEYKHMTDSYILKKNYERNLLKDFSFDFVVAFEEKMTELMLALNPVEEIHGAAKMIEYVLAETNYAVCFATGSFLKPALIKLEQAFIPFDEKCVVGSNQVFTRAELVQQSINNAKEHFNVAEFEDIISFGDGLWDLKTAEELNIQFVGVGKKNKNELIANGAKLVMKNWMEFDLEEVEKVLGL